MDRKLCLHKTFTKSRNVRIFIKRKKGWLDLLLVLSFSCFTVQDYLCGCLSAVFSGWLRVKLDIDSKRKGQVSQKPTNCGKDAVWPQTASAKQSFLLKSWKMLIILCHIAFMDTNLLHLLYILLSACWNKSSCSQTVWNYLTCEINDKTHSSKKCTTAETASFPSHFVRFG